MNKNINVELIMYKAQLFGINTRLISYLLDSSIHFDKDILKKMNTISSALNKIEKYSQLSVQV